MAKTKKAARLTREHRRRQLELNRRVMSQVAESFDDLIDIDNLGLTVQEYIDTVAGLVSDGYIQSQQFALDYTSRFKQAETGRGSLPEISRPLLSFDEIRKAIRGSTLSGMLSARRGGATTLEVLDRGRVNAMGTSGSLVQSGGRNAIVDVTNRDDDAIGWQRITSGNPCAFCAMIASRGPVYKGEQSANFRAHWPGPNGGGLCECIAEPVYSEEDISAQNRVLRQLWNESTAGLSGNNALNAFRAAMRDQDSFTRVRSSGRGPFPTGMNDATEVPRFEEFEYAERNFGQIPEASFEAVDEYLTGDAFFWNVALRNEQGGLPQGREEMTRSLDAAMSPVAESVIVRRVGTWNEMEMPGGQRNSEAPGDVNSLVGTVQTQYGYTSTSVGQDFARGFNADVEFVIKVPEGYPAAWIAERSSIPEQRELLLQRGSRFLVHDTSLRNDRTVIQMEVVPEGVNLTRFQPERRRVE